MARPKGSRRHRRVREAAAPGYPPGAPQPELTGVVLDSDVIIEILRGRAATLDAALAVEQSSVPTFCTPIAWAEVYAGARPAEEALTRAFFEARGEVVLDGNVGRHAGGYLARRAVLRASVGSALTRLERHPGNRPQRAALPPADPRSRRNPGPGIDGP